MPVCARSGCRKSYEEKDNIVNACSYHPGAPVFHEGLKGYSCCSKRVTDFDEFLKIEGCATGKHSVVAEAVSAPTTTKSKNSTPTTSSLSESGVETYGAGGLATATANLNITSVATTSIPVRNAPQRENIFLKPAELPCKDPEDSTIPVGTVCKRKSCGYAFISDKVSRNGGDGATCTYHSGAPIFHEGSKGWSCCSRRVLEFDEFLKISGCKSGNHLFLDPPEDPNAEQIVACRRDWYQTQSTVLLTVYAKNVNKSTSTVTFYTDAIDLDLKMNNGTRYVDRIYLFQPIDYTTSTFEFLSTKVEINLKKTNGISWAQLEVLESNVQSLKSWTTFGSTGSNVGTVGGKEIHVNRDAPIYAASK